MTGSDRSNGLESLGLAGPLAGKPPGRPRNRSQPAPERSPTAPGSVLRSVGFSSYTTRSGSLSTTSATRCSCHCTKRYSLLDARPPQVSPRRGDGECALRAGGGDPSTVLPLGVPCTHPSGTTRLLPPARRHPSPSLPCPARPPATSACCAPCCAVSCCRPCPSWSRPAAPGNRPAGQARSGPSARPRREPPCARRPPARPAPAPGVPVPVAAPAPCRTRAPRPSTTRSWNWSSAPRRARARRSGACTTTTATRSTATSTTGSAAGPRPRT